MVLCLVIGLLCFVCVCVRGCVCADLSSVCVMFGTLVPSVPAGTLVPTGALVPTRNAWPGGSFVPARNDRSGGSIRFNFQKVKLLF